MSTGETVIRFYKDSVSEIKISQDDSMDVFRLVACAGGTVVDGLTENDLWIIRDLCTRAINHVARERERKRADRRGDP